MDLISPASLYNLVKEKKEFALVDLREDGSFGARHLLFAVNIPFSHLEFLTSFSVAARWNGYRLLEVPPEGAR